jgi:hypothetical protein
MDNDKKEDENLGSFYMDRQRSGPQPRRQLPPGLLTGVAVLAFAGIIWYAYPRGAEKYTDMDVPVVKADTAPIKEQPTEPGGMDIPHQDSTVFDPLEKKPADEVEKLQPTPEEPMDKEQAIKAVEEPPPMVTAMAPKTELDLQMKDAGNGTEKVVSAVEAAPPIAKAPVVEVPRDEKSPADGLVKIGPVSEETKPLVETKPAAAVSTGTTKVQLGSYRDIDSLKKDWDRLKKKYPEFLGGLTMQAVQVNLPGKGIYYRLHAGKVSEARAKEICEALKAGGCILVK